MKYVKLGLSGMTVDAKVTQGNTIKAGCTANSDLPTTTPPQATFGAAITDLAAKLQARKAAFEAAKAATEALHDSEATYNTLVAQLAAFCEGALGGDAQKLERAGFTLRKVPAPLPELGMVEGLKLKANDLTGVLFARWNTLNGASSFEVQLCADPMTDQGWEMVQSSPTTKTALENLTSGTRQWVRVRGVASDNRGPWSQPAGKIVP